MNKKKRSVITPNGIKKKKDKTTETKGLPSYVVFLKLRNHQVSDLSRQKFGNVTWQRQ